MVRLEVAKGKLRAQRKMAGRILVVLGLTLAPRQLECVPFRQDRDNGRRILRVGR